MRFLITPGPLLFQIFYSAICHTEDKTGMGTSNLMRMSFSL